MESDSKSGWWLKLHNAFEASKRAAVSKDHPPLPTFIQLEPTTSCNFNCVTCSRKTLNRANRNLSLGDYIRITNEFPSLNSINLTGMGEPFLNPNLHEILQFSRWTHIRVQIGTNGSVVDKHLDELQYLEQLGFSLDSADPFHFGLVRRGGEFMKVVDNLRRALEEKNAKGYPLEISTNTVVCHLNYEEMPKIAELAVSLGVDQIGFVEAENWEVEGEKGYPAEREFIMKAREKHKEIQATMDGIRKRYPNVKVIHTSIDKLKPRCRWAFIWTMITVDGFVVPCCRRPNPEVINFGNIFETPFREIWDSEKYVDFRRKMSLNSQNPICDECPD